MTKTEALLAVEGWRDRSGASDIDKAIVERPATYCVVNDGRVFQFDSVDELDVFMQGKDLRQFHTFVRFDPLSADRLELRRSALRALQYVNQ